MKESLPELKVSPIGHSILRTLLYFDIFNYPLTLEEIYTFSGKGYVSFDILQTETNILETAGVIFSFDGFYTTQNDDTNVSRRVKGNREAEKHLPMARKRATLIARFPFVRAVMASGSLSKGYMDENSDLDFFVITAPNRLWIARTLFVLYRKIFVPRNRHKEFCTNYFLASDQLEIEEKNLFTATELTTLIPLHNFEIYLNLISANPWVHDYLPNSRPKKNILSEVNRESAIKVLGEKMLSLAFGKQIDRLLMRLTMARLKRKHEKKFSASDFSLALKAKPYVSKVHLGNNQSRVLSRLQEKIKEFEARFALAFTHA